MRSREFTLLIDLLQFGGKPVVISTREIGKEVETKKTESGSEYPSIHLLQAPCIRENKETHGVS
jgi:hypothetical protein